MTKKKSTELLGALIDTRPPSEQEKDFLIDEIVVSAAPVEWIEKPESKWRKFPIFDQNGSGSCVAQSMAKLLGIMYFLKYSDYVHFSATHIYQRRSNKPDGGMSGDEAFQIAQKGATLEALTASQKLTDSQMDSVKVDSCKVQVGEIFKIGNYVSLPNGDIDMIASTIQKTGKAVMVWFYFKSDEWKKTVPQIKYPALQLNGTGTLRHSVVAVDFTIYQGKKALIIEDSWGVDTGMAGRRIITEDFFKKRNWFAKYPIGFKFDEGQTIQKPKYTFTKVLNFTPEYTYEADVVALQNILKYEGLFPTNTDSTGYYGAITANAVLEFQKKHGVASWSELEAVQGKTVGEKTIAKLNQIYSK